MEKINLNTKKAQGIIDSYYKTPYRSLDQVYDFHHSSAKDNAMARCERIMRGLKGTDMLITSHNKWFFTVAFRFVKDGKSCLAYITPKGDYYIELRDANDKDSLNADDWYNRTKAEYDGFCERTKKHLANACPTLNSREDVDDIMRVSKAFDAMFRLLDEKE
jgi:hypothetical protein